ncbi:MAG: STAS domain-containing protein [Desulfomonilia bacterium]|jgi:anti-anti-sigma regulatory factor
MAKIDKIDNDNTMILRVQGALSIQDASALRDCLLKALGSTESLVIDLSGAEAIDLACLQVLCSAHKTFSKAQKSIGITGELPEGIVRSLSSVALVPDACDRESHGPCLWATGGKNE